MSIVETEITDIELTEADLTGFVTSEFLAPGATLPLLCFRPAKARASLDEMTNWLRTNRDFIERQLVKYGALLFRDFPLNTADDFEQFALAISDKLLEYRERSSPRSQVGENVYTSN